MKEDKDNVIFEFNMNFIKMIELTLLTYLTFSQTRFIRREWSGYPKNFFRVLSLNTKI